MTDQLTVAMISGGFALLVALLGVGGAIAAQVVATRRAFENSLALFERQAAEAQQAREEATRIESRHRFADQKRTTYSRALGLADGISTACKEARTAEENLERILETPDHGAHHADHLAQTAGDYRREANEHRDRAESLTSLLAEVVGEIELLSDNAVSSACARLRSRAHTTHDDQESRYFEAREQFLLAARNELGVQPG